jgi:hypothetical protein
MPTPPLTPELRAELLEHITHACVLWTEDVMKGYFTDPKSSEAQQMVLEAYAHAIQRIAKRLPNRQAVLKTFLIELQDLVNKEST